jgi:hypothetical protein
MMLRASNIFSIKKAFCMTHPLIAQQRQLIGTSVEEVPKDNDDDTGRNAANLVFLLVCVVR